MDLRTSPLCESYIAASAFNDPEPVFPLHVYVCDSCWLVQLEEFVPPGEIFTEYAYFSSYSDAWVAHAKRYVEAIIPRLGLHEGSLIVELASNDGYLLQHAVAAGVPVLGIEPAANVARDAEARGVPTLVEFFGRELAGRLAAEGRQADLIVGNNVLAQVPDVNDFVAGIKILLAEGGTVTMEWPHLMRLVEENQFDTIYHEHYCYFSWISACNIFERHGLKLYDVEELPTHGGSLRMYAAHADDESKPLSPQAQALARREAEAGVADLSYYADFAERVKETKWQILEFLIAARRAGKVVAGYGAPGKGNTLLNYCGIGTDLIDYTVDRNPYKQGKFLPGTRIPIYAPDRIRETRPDYLFILPWNFKDEIMEQMADIRDWGGKFIVPIPTITVVE